MPHACHPSGAILLRHLFHLLLVAVAVGVLLIAGGAAAIRVSRVLAGRF